MSREPSISHFVAITDPSVRFNDSAQVADTCGCVVAACDDPHFAEGLIDLFQCSDTEQDVRLTVLPAGALSRAQIVLAKRELERARSIGASLDSEEYATNDPTFALIGHVAITLVNLAAELEAVVEIAPHSAGDPPAPSNGRERKENAGTTLHEAIQRLEHALDRHRLTFLFFATAKRYNEMLRNSRHGMEEAVRKEDVLGYERVMKDIDDEGEFLLRQRVYFERFAEKAIGAFGPGEGGKPPGEESTHPYWSLDEGSASYLQDTAQAILAAARDLDRADTARTCQDIVRTAINVAYDEGRSRWYSAIITRWKYLTRLDDALASVRGYLLPASRAVSSVANDEPYPWDTCFLGVEWDERIFNHDPASCGTCVSDPSYLPMAEGKAYFYKCFHDAGERLLRLFNKSIRPAISSEGETKVEVRFVLALADKLDSDDVFLIEEQLEAVSGRVFSRHHEWRIEQGMLMAEHLVVLDGAHLIDQKPPLGKPSLALEFLFDRAERWHERISLPRKATKSASKPASEEPKSKDAGVDGAHPLLPTAIIAAMSLRDLTRIARFYPDAIGAEETSRIYEKLKSALVSAAQVVGLGHIFDAIPLPTLEDTGADTGFSAVMATIMMHHKDFTFHGEVDSEQSQEAHQQLLSKCLATCDSGIKDIGEQLHRIRLFDCLLPAPGAGKEYASPRRAVRMVEIYWTMLRRLLAHHASAYASYRPHPLRLMLTSMQRRFRIAFERLQDFQIDNDSQESIDALIGTLLDGDPDELTVDEDWTYRRFDAVDRFIEGLREKIGIGVFELTYAEADFCEYCDKAIGEYTARVDKAWNRMLNGSARGESNQSDKSHSLTPPSAPTAVTSETARTSSPIPGDKSLDQPIQPFSGGVMTFLSDRVELCGVDICSGPRSRTRRRILDLLRQQREDGTFVAYSGDTLAAEVEPSMNQRSIAGAVRDLRNDIMESLRNRANLDCGHKDVILSGGTGYRLTECVTVHIEESVTTGSITDIADKDGVPDVRDDVDACVRDVLDAPAKARRSWILEQLRGGAQLKAPEVARQFSCSVKTAQRDLAALKDAEIIEFAGAARTGYYRLRVVASGDHSLRR